MNRTGKTLMTLMATAVCIYAAVVIGIAAVSLVSAQPQGAPAETEKEVMMEDVQKCMMRCNKMCKSNMDSISAVRASLDAASKALDADDTLTAKAEVEKAKNVLTDMRQSIEKCMQQMPPVNRRCPITGRPIDKTKTSAELTSMYKGMKIGFCCPACPPEWDKLTDAEKDAKLKEVMPMSYKEKMMEKGVEMTGQTRGKAGGYD